MSNKGKDKGARTSSPPPPRPNSEERKAESALEAANARLDSAVKDASVVTAIQGRAVEQGGDDFDVEQGHVLPTGGASVLGGEFEAPPRIGRPLRRGSDTTEISPEVAARKRKFDAVVWGSSKL